MNDAKKHESVEGDCAQLSGPGVPDILERATIGASVGRVGVITDTGYVIYTPCDALLFLTGCAHRHATDEPEVM